MINIFGMTGEVGVVELPVEIWVHILAHLPPQVLVEVRRVCAVWRVVIEAQAGRAVNGLGYYDRIPNMSWAATFLTLHEIHADLGSGTLKVRVARDAAGTYRGSQALLTKLGGRVAVITVDQRGAMSVWDPLTGEDTRPKLFGQLRDCTRVRAGFEAVSLWLSRLPVLAVACGTYGDRQLLFRYLRSSAIETWDLTEQRCLAVKWTSLGYSPLLQFHMFEGKAFLVSDASSQRICVWKIGQSTTLLQPIFTTNAVVFHATTAGLVATNATGHLFSWSPSGGIGAIGTGIPRACRLTVLTSVPSVCIGIGGSDGRVAIWDGATRICDGHHRDCVTGLASVSLAGRQLLISGGKDGRLLFHDVQTGARLGRIKRHRPIISVAVVPSPHRFVLLVGFADPTNGGRLEVLGFNRRMSPACD